MRSRTSHLAATLAVLAVLVQVALGGLGGKLCIRMAPFQPSGGCTTGCCDRGQPGDHALVVASDQDDLPGDSECCVGIGDSAILAPVFGQGQIRSAGGPDLPLPAVERTGFDCSRSPIAVAAGVAAHPPPALVVIRTTVLLV